jgi:hypothetical protein
MSEVIEEFLIIDDTIIDSNPNKKLKTENTVETNDKEVINESNQEDIQEVDLNKELQLVEDPLAPSESEEESDNDDLNVININAYEIHGTISINNNLKMIMIALCVTSHLTVLWLSLLYSHFFN